jgi:hypothetical protein
MWTASQIGWFDETIFMLPDTTIGKDSDGVLFQTEKITTKNYAFWYRGSYRWYFAIYMAS